VTLIGYCWEKGHLALVYEHMSQGSLLDHLRGLSIASLLSIGLGITSYVTFSNCIEISAHGSDLRSHISSLTFSGI
jgi:hypothetical protein